MGIIMIATILIGFAIYVIKEREYDPENKDRVIDYTVW